MTDPTDARPSGSVRRPTGPRRRTPWSTALLALAVLGSLATSAVATTPAGAATGSAGSQGQIVTPAAVTLTGVSQVVGGDEHTCAIVTGGQVRCWGENVLAQLGTGDRITSGAAVAVTGLSGATQIASSRLHTCVLVAGGQARCWGYGLFGQLGDNATTTRSNPVAVTGLSGATRLATGRYHTCAIVAGGQVRCWGRNQSGQLGTGSTGGPSSTFVAVNGLSGASTIDAGDLHTCSTIAGGQVRCWGSNSTGQLGDGTTTTSASIVGVPGLTDASTVTAGGRHTCALVPGGQVRCWGRSAGGQLGNGTATGAVWEPATIQGLAGATGVATGGPTSLSSHSCALLGSGQVRCWGANDTGQLGTGSTDPFTATISPVAVTGLSGATRVVAGGRHTCAIVAGGQVRCWGSNSDGQLGDGTGTDRPAPVAVPGLSGATQIAAGREHTCAIVAGGQVRCWGQNTDGQLGNNTSGPDQLLPVSVTGLSGASQLAAGDFHTCAIISGGQIRCWGSDSSGQLGNGDPANSSVVPVAVSGLSGATGIAAGADHTCAVVSGGQGRCWGRNSSGQLGNGSTSPGATTTPVAVTGLSGATQVSAGPKHTCVLVTGGQGRCWGSNTSGELGTGNYVSSTTPVGVSGLSGAVALSSASSAGSPESHTCALLAVGQVRCWGNNEDGQVAQPLTSTVPVTVVT